MNKGLVNNWLQIAQRLLLPPVCLVCGGPGVETRDLCEGCVRDLPWLPKGCYQCAMPLPAAAGEQPVCGSCLQEAPAFDHTIALWNYSTPVDRLLQGLKFERRLEVARLCGELLAQRLLRRATPWPDKLIPTPLHPTRLRERGYNQALELARPVGRALGLTPDLRLCERIRPTPPQTDLPAAQRYRNVRNAFAVTPGTLANLSVAIVDDVMTTGSTMAALSTTLKQAGATRVEVWVIARTI